METELAVIPAQAGIHGCHYCLFMDPGLRRDDDIDCLSGNYA
ncbi:MAG: hypothetical protein BMS9Abin06_0362 [Gammaproteobacteria bacterium]|nr:MAG: hypothetical protein BMS9Abin06_0362 [Gammaproteobacteria bacterium]